MSAVQVCARCAARWPVVGGPAQWCPRCHGVLLSPTDPARPEPPSRRNFRWVARRPGASPRRSGPDAGTPTAAAGPPSYREMPRWGLLDPPPAEADDDDEYGPPERLADLAPTLLTAAAVLFAVGALAELFRYALLLRNRSTLISPTVLAVSDGLVGAAGTMAPMVALAAAAASVAWLLRARAAHYAAAGRSDPRRQAAVVAGCLVPVLNLVFPGVYLHELDERNTKTRNLIRLWWALWVGGGLLAAVNLLWRSQDSVQARADGVLLAAAGNLVAVAVAVLTLLVIRRVDGLALTGRPRDRTRWVLVP
ncbi:DUF4328 domain-containing protein [Rhodococcus kronopolitis]|uniref:DUF4328 domain-containing protein n=1 Tax=Rhodococcus kronopolitis TaxID=1460226 RepID=A0ABV9FZH2_9NOCA